MADRQGSIRRELITWLQYFVIAFIAAAVAENALTSRQSGIAGINQPNFDEINIRQMILSMWDRYYRWWLYIFVGLSAVRFLVLFILSRRKENLNP